MDLKNYIEDLIGKAKAAQKEFETYSQEDVDKVVRAVGKAIYDEGDPLAKMAIEETHMGSYEDKILKNKGKAMAVWNHLKNKKSVGIIRYIEDQGLVEIAHPKGVIGAVTPVTNPVMTPMHNAMIALKGANAIIIAPHPAGKHTGKRACDVMRAALKEVGAPVDLIQCIEPDLISVESSALLMGMADVCVATGGPGMVKAAYSAGKPAYGVGAGNMQCIMDEDADIVDAVPKIIRGRCYDNGVLCTCEQNVICHEDKVDAILAEFEKQGCYYVDDPKKVDMLRDCIFPGGELNKKAVGLQAYEIAQMAGFEVPKDTKLLLAKAGGAGTADTFSREKLFPVLAVYTYKTWKEGVDIAVANLEYEGKGHSCTIHSFTKENIEYAGIKLPVSRVLINGIGSSGVGGAYTNGFAPTATLGCGSWGNNSISENLDYFHLINISRIGYTDPNKRIPTPDEVWG
ncbi:aldehyde dehydrogenase family protein [Bacillota bacterium]